MSYSICRKHNRTDPWGCRECLREEVGEIIEKGNARLAKRIKAIFAALSKGPTP